MILLCPHCHQMIEIIQLRCRIFRCGIYKENYKQIDPHSSKEKCFQLIKNNQIYGCGKPFLINQSLEAEKCDYL